MAKIKRLVQSVNKFTINDSSKVFCDDITYIVTGDNGEQIKLTATFPTTYNGLKAVFLIKVPADSTSTTAPTLTNYKVVGSSLINAGTAGLTIDLDEWSQLSATAYVVPANNGTTAAGTADLA